MRYAWARNGLYKDLDPQVVGDHIDALIDQYNEHLTHEGVLEDARKRTSPLHAALEWNDAEAAEKHRHHQTKLLVNSLVPLKNGKKQRTRAFVFVRHGKYGRKVYMNIRSAMGRPDMKAQIVENALKGLNQWIGRYGNTRELRSVSKTVETLRRRIEAQLMSQIL